MRSRLLGPSNNAIVSILLTAVIGFWCSQALGQELSATQKEVWKMEETYFELWKNGDMQGFTELHHKDAIIWGNKSAWPKDRSIIDMGGVAGDGIGELLDSFELELHEIKILGSIAISQYTARIKRLGKDYRLRLSHTWVKQGGKWQIIGAMHDSCSELPSCL